MKKITKVFAMALILALALSLTAVAADPSDKPVIDPTPGPVTFADADCTVLNINFTNDAIVNGEDYIVWVVAGTNSGNNTVYIPTVTSILYIGQDTADGKNFTFSGAYPKQIVDCAVMISGKGMEAIDTLDGNQDGLYTLATIKAPYKLGDVDLDGDITASDAATVLRMVAGSESNATAIQWLAAEVDRDGSVTASDAAWLLRYVAGAESF